MASSHTNPAVISAVPLKAEALDSFPFPKDVRVTLEEMGRSYGYNSLIRRVSERSFVMRTVDKTFRTPQQLLHFRFDQQDRFHCQCSQYKHVTSLSSSSTAPELSKRCIHMYLFFWACLSNAELQSTFSLYLQGTNGNLQ
jgi:hypothetical protein